jgi:hypothetical protein
VRQLLVQVGRSDGIERAEKAAQNHELRIEDVGRVPERNGKEVELTLDFLQHIR